jgi:RNA polymerase sigma-70 factor (ECF subfamily)
VTRSTPAALAMTDLLRVFLDAVSPERRECFVAGEALREGLQQLHARACAAWPTLAFDAAALVEACAQRVENAEALASLRIEELALALACARGDAGALRAFEQHHGRDIALALARAGVEPAAVDDVAQLVRSRLFVGDPPRIAAFSGRGELANWVRTVAVRVAISSRRGRAPLDRATASVPSRLPIDDDPELAWLREHHRAGFKAAFSQVLSQLDDEERALLRFKFLDGLTLEELAQLFGTHRATIARRVARLRDQLAEDLCAAFGTQPGITRAQLESIARLLRADLDLSLSRLLADDGATTPP